MLAWIIFFIVLLLIAVIFLIAILVQRQMFRSLTIEKYSSVAKFPFYEKRFVREPVSFLSGKNRLKGYLYPAKTEQGGPKGLIVFSHGVWSGPEEYLMMLLWFVEHGYSVFTYNNTSYNGSEGKWARGLYQSAIDLDAALTYIEHEKRFEKLPRFLLGHSWGGFAVTAVLNFGHPVDGVISLSGFDRPIQMTMSVARSMFGPLACLFSIPMRVINRALFGKKISLNAVDGINRTKAPVLLVHGKEDDFIYYDTLSILSQKDRITNPNLETLTLDHHGFSGHNSYFLSEESQTCAENINRRFEEEAKKKKKEDRPAFRKEYYENLDLKKTNEPNTALYRKFLDFYERCLEARETRGE